MEENIKIPISEQFTSANGVENIKSGVMAVSTATQVVNVVILALNLPMAIAVMKLFQNIDYLGMLSLNFIPLNLSIFLEFFDQNLFGFIPNPFEGIAYPSTGCPLDKPWIFFRDGGSCSFLKEAGPYIIVFLILFTVKLIVKLSLPAKVQKKKIDQDKSVNMGLNQDGIKVKEKSSGKNGKSVV